MSFRLCEDFHDRLVARQRAVAEVRDRVQLRVGLDDPVGQIGQGLFDADVGGHFGHPMRNRRQNQATRYKLRSAGAGKFTNFTAAGRISHWYQK